LIAFVQRLWSIVLQSTRKTNRAGESDSQRERLSTPFARSSLVAIAAGLVVLLHRMERARKAEREPVFQPT
jgi:hypothetical protein